MLSLKFSSISIESIINAESQQDQISKGTATSKPSKPVKPEAEKVLKAPELSAEEARTRERWKRLLEMVKKGKVESVAKFLTKYDSLQGLWKHEGDGESKTRKFLGVWPTWLLEEEGMGFRGEITLLVRFLVIYLGLI
jgi:hypothetical protein